MDIRWFHDLANLAQTGNFSQAADLGNISQPALSRRIRSLENWVGTRLVDRSRHPIELTAFGQQMLEAGMQAITRIESARNQIRESLSQPDRYVVTFAAQHSIGWRFFPTWLQLFENEFGPILSRLRADNLPNCLDDLSRGEADFVISYESEHSQRRPPAGAFESITIGRDRLVPVSKATTSGEPLFNLDDDSASAIPYLRFGQQAPIGQHVTPLLESRAMESRLNVIYENPMVGALRIRVQDGRGIAWLPLSLIQPDLDAGAVAIAGEISWSIELDIELHRQQEQGNEFTRRIWEFLAHREPLHVTSDLL